MEPLNTINMKKTSNSLNKNRILMGRTYYFPSITHKELSSIKDLKHEINYKSRTKKQYNNFKNFHTEVLKTNFKDNPKYTSLYNRTLNQTTTEFNFPELNLQNNNNPNKIIKLYVNSNTISFLNKGLIKKNKKNKSKMFKNSNNKTKKNDMSNISTNGNISLSTNSYKFSKLNKYTSSSTDFNNNSYLNINKFINNSNQTLNDISFEQKVKTYNSNNTSSSLNKLNKNKYINNFLTKSNSNISYINDNNSKKFLSNLNPIYTLLKKEFLSEFQRKTKDISYLKFIMMKKKLDIELEKERIISEIEKQNLSRYNLNMLIDTFNRYNDSKFEYLNYLKKTVSEEREKNEKLKEDKITIMNDIYMIRHKTLRLENRFRNYLNDKFFLLSVKNHSFKLSKFSREDQEDYNNDLKKLEILNIMLKVTAREFQNKENDNEKNGSRRLSIKRKTRLTIINNKTSLFFNNNNIKSPINTFKRQNTRTVTKKYYSLYDSKPILSSTQYQLLKTNFKATPLYNDTFYFNKDLQQTSNNIQSSLVEYNKISKELQIMKNNLYKSKLEMKNIEKYEKFVKEEIVLYKKNLENIKQLNYSLINYQKYLLNIDVLNLNKGKVSISIDKILNNIFNSKDDILIEYLDNLKKRTGIEKLVIIERGFEFLLNYKEIQKQTNSRKYNIIESKIEDKNRIKLSEFKQKRTQKKINSIIKKVINKNKKIIFVSRRKVNNGFNPEIHKKKKIRIKDLNNIFGNFDID